MTKKTRRKTAASLQGKSVLAAVLEPATAAKLAKRYKVPPTEISAWKQQLP